MNLKSYDKKKSYLYLIAFLLPYNECKWVYLKKLCCYNSTLDPFNGQIVNFISKPPKVIESRTYVKKANLECYRNNTVLLLWQHLQLVKLS